MAQMRAKKRKSPLRGSIGAAPAQKTKKWSFLVGKMADPPPIIIPANYAARAFFHMMGMQDPMRTSSLGVGVVEKKRAKVRWFLGGVDL